MDVRQARATNLVALIGRYRSLRAFADDAGVVPAHASQMRTGVRRMGDEIARRIEQRLRLPHGWMDQPHPAGKGDVPATPAHAPSGEARIAEDRPDDPYATAFAARVASRDRLSRIMGGMTEDELNLLADIAERLSRHPAK